MTGLFRRMKGALFHLGEKFVSFGDELFYSYLRRNLFFGRSLVQKIGVILADFGCLIQDLFRFPVYRANGQEWKIIYAGHQKERPEIEHLFFPNGEISWDEVGQVSIWNLNRDIKGWLADGNDLVITDLCRAFPSFARVKFNFKVPLWVNQSMNLPEKVETLLEGPILASKRKQINKLTREGYTFKQGKDIDDLACFYNEIYIPSVQKSFGDRAKSVNMDDLRVWFEHGGLRFVMHGDRHVAASLYFKTESSYVIVLSGVLEDEIKKNIKSLLYWADITCAAELGFRKVNFGGSRPWTSDGVFEYKRRWQNYVYDYEPVHTDWHFYGDDLPPEKMNFLNQVGFITKINGKFYRTFISQEKSAIIPEDAEKLRGEAKEAGLEGIVLCSPYAKLKIGHEKLLVENSE